MQYRSHFTWFLTALIVRKYMSIYGPKSRGLNIEVISKEITILILLTFIDPTGFTGTSRQRNSFIKTMGFHGFFSNL